MPIINLIFECLTRIKVEQENSRIGDWIITVIDEILMWLGMEKETEFLTSAEEFIFIMEDIFRTHDITSDEGHEFLELLYGAMNNAKKDVVLRLTQQGINWEYKFIFLVREPSFCLS